jgi:peptide/nickel transport system permease protein
MLGVVVLIAIFAPLLAQHDPYTQNLARRLVPPFWHPRGDWAHPLGTGRARARLPARTLYGPASHF